MGTKRKASYRFSMGTINHATGALPMPALSFGDKTVFDIEGAAWGHASHPLTFDHLALIQRALNAYDGPQPRLKGPDCDHDAWYFDCGRGDDDEGIGCHECDEQDGLVGARRDA